MTIREPEQRPYLSIQHVTDCFSEAMEKRVGLTGNRGLKRQTFVQLKFALRSVLRGLNANQNLLDFTRDDARKPVDYWSSPQRGVAERTAAKYCKTLERMIGWADNESLGGFTKRKIDDLFRFANARGKVERFDADRLRTLLTAANHARQISGI